jgi:ankyrin repeat protein
MTDLRVELIKNSVWHDSLERANAILVEHPELASSDIHIAAILGDDPAVRRFLAQDPACALATSEPWGGTPLTYLCMSRYLRLDPSRTDAFLRAAAALLDAGADPNGGFWTKGQHPEYETPLYGAAGIAHHAAMTRLLLERGADPNDGEAVYHSPEGYDNAAFQLLVDTGKLTPDSLTLMLIRKIDWHDFDGAKYLLEHGAPASRSWHRRGRRPLNHALARSNRLAIIELLLDHGADPTLIDDDLTAIARAAHEGRRDVLELFKQRGIDTTLTGVDRLIAALALDETATVRSIQEQEPALVDEVKKMGGDLLAAFAGNGNTAGVRQLLDLGVPVDSPFARGDGYFDEPKGSLAIHIAAWRANHDIVKLLIERGSPIDTPDANRRTPLALAIKACVDSYWSWRRSPDSVDALLRAGVSTRGVPYPTGYAEVDALLDRHDARA